MAAPMSVIPSATVRPMPSSALIRWDSTATTAMINAIGTNAAPASVGLKPSTFCSQSALKK